MINYQINHMKKYGSEKILAHTPGGSMTKRTVRGRTGQ